MQRTLRSLQNMLTYIFTDIKSLRKTLKTLGILEVAAGAKISKTKSKILMIGKTIPFPPWLNSHGLLLVDPMQPTAYLGALALTERRRVDESQRVMERISRTVQHFSTFKLSLEGRLVALKGVVFPTLIYPLMTACFKKGTFKRLDTILRRYVWAVNAEGNQKTALVAWSLLAQPTDVGGLGIFDLQHFQKALMCRVIFRALLDPEGSLWAPVLADRFLGVTPQDLGKALCHKQLPGASRLGPVTSLLVRAWEDFMSSMRWIPPENPHIPGSDVKLGCFIIARQWADVKEASTVAANIWRWSLALGFQSLEEINQRPAIIRQRINGLLSATDRKVMGFILQGNFRSGDSAWTGTEWRAENSTKDLSLPWKTTEVYTAIRGENSQARVMNDRLHLSWTVQEWRAIWSLTNITGLSQRHKTFLWRIVTNAFLTGKREKRMGFDTFSCAFCGGGVEDTTHAIFTCPRWSEIWRSLATQVQGWREIREMAEDLKSPIQVLRWITNTAGSEKLFTVWFLAITWRTLWAEICLLRYEGKCNTVDYRRVTYLFLEELHARRGMLKKEIVHSFASRL
ncbi:hypothetical protein R1sor_026454 [Riccia sorocarpa]|uniref:Reverse transcriptase zinc-binding domain-containing protein n=1 Tax=Riccia sorocarpa TaxID=122646 RepID=A0ABD3GCX7_9MARC